jgi:hypothetical protein
MAWTVGKMPTQEQVLFREMVPYLTASAFFVAGLTMAIVGGITASTVTFGVGLGIVVALTVRGYLRAERNIVG